MITVHYHRFDNDYQDVSLWTWAPDAESEENYIELGPAGWDDYGPYFEIDRQRFVTGGGVTMIGLIPRLRHDWQYKDGEDRMWRQEMGEEIWLLGGDPKIHRTKPDTSPCVQKAFLDGPEILVVGLSHSIETERLTPARMTLRSAKATIPIGLTQPLEVIERRTKCFQAKLEQEPDPMEKMTFQVTGYRAGKVQLRGMLLNRNLFYYDGELGANYTKEKTTFRLFAPEAAQADVVIYEEPKSLRGRQVYPMKPIGGGGWETEIRGDLGNRCYRVRVQSEDRLAGNEVLDPYVKLGLGHDAHGMIIDPRNHDPEGFRPMKRPDLPPGPESCIVTEVHLRDFTIAKSSGIPAELRGKYLGAVKEGASLPGTDLKTGIDHMAELGVTHVLLMPIHDFDNIETRDDYDWGFMPSNFFSPEGWYATKTDDVSRIMETKTMVQKFHERGLGVILSVVFNHTAPLAPFESIAPRYYHRRKDDGSFWNGSATGNEFQTEAPMVRKLIVDCCRYWVEEYGVDGFHFNLMGLVDLDTLREVRDELHKIEPRLVLMGEPWTGGLPGEAGIDRITSKFMIAGIGISGLNDHFIADLKGRPGSDSRGYLFDGGNVQGVKRGIQGAIFDWSWHPGDAVQYISSHVHLTLWDKIAEEEPDLDEAERIRIQKLALSILLTSQGMIFLHSGVELARTKFGNPNSYNANDEINQLDWRRKERFFPLFDFVRQLIELRKAHPVFRLSTREAVQQRLHFRERKLPSDKLIVFTLYGGGLEGETWEEAVVLINPEPRDWDAPIPAGSWRTIIHNSEFPSQEDANEGRVTIARRSLTLLAKSAE